MLHIVLAVLIPVVQWDDKYRDVIVGCLTAIIQHPLVAYLLSSCPAYQALGQF